LKFFATFFLMKSEHTSKTNQYQFKIGPIIYNTYDFIRISQTHRYSLNTGIYVFDLSPKFYICQTWGVVVGI